MRKILSLERCSHRRARSRGEWKETEVDKTFKITEGAVSETFSFTLSELGLDSTKGFFKVEVK